MIEVRPQTCPGEHVKTEEARGIAFLPDGKHKETHAGRLPPDAEFHEATIIWQFSLEPHDLDKKAAVSLRGFALRLTLTHSAHSKAQDFFRR